MNETQADRQRDLRGDCGRSFDDLTDTLFAGHHQPLRVWLLCLYFMGLNLSNWQIARELGVNEDSAHEMATQLRQGIVVRPPEVVLSGEVECDEVCVVAGHQGHPEAVKKRETRLAAASERSSRSQHSGQRKAADLWDDSTHGRGRTADARQRPIGHDRADLESHDQPRHDGTRAGLKVWPKLFHNLRATRQTELSDTFPAHVVCEWLGNSERVAAMHYLHTTDEQFAKAMQEPVQPIG